MTDEPQIKITVYRPLNGIRTPYVLILDRVRNLVSDTVDEVELSRIKASPHLLARHQIDSPTPAVAHEKAMYQAGLVRHITEKGIVISREPLDEWSRKLEEWLDTSKPNPFPGSEDLRMDYFEERADTVRRIEEGSCPGCEINRLLIDYRVKLTAFQKEQAE